MCVTEPLCGTEEYEGVNSKTPRNVFLPKTVQPPYILVFKVTLECVWGRGVWGGGKGGEPNKKKMIGKNYFIYS